MRRAALQAGLVLQRCSAVMPTSVCVRASAPSLCLRSLHSSVPSLREQFDKDKARMKQKKEKAAEVKKKAGAMKDKSSNVEAASGVGMSVPAMEEKMEEYVEAMKAALAQIKAGRAVPAQLDDVIVSAHGKLMPLKAIGQISARNATTLVVQVYDPSLVKEVDRSIRLHSPTLNPQVEEGGAVVVAFPKVTRDVRDGLVKEVSKRAEETRNHLRTIRQQYLQQLKTLAAGNDGISRDLMQDLKTQIQASHDAIAANVKKLQEEKEKEIQQV